MEYYSRCVYSFVFTFIILCANAQDTDNSYRAKEKQAIQKLKKLAGSVEPSYLNEDFMLLKFLRDKNMNVNEAHIKLKEAVEWRVKNKIDKIRDENILTELTPPRYEGPDKSGRPIVYVRPAQWDIRRVLLAGQRDLLIRKWAQLVDTVTMYKILEARNSTGKDIRDAVMVLDADGYNLRQHACLNCFSTFFEWVRLYEKNYPQYLAHFYILNAPRVFAPLLELLRGVFSEYTNKIMQVIGPDKQEWKAELLKVIDKNELLKAYGGNKD